MNSKLSNKPSRKDRPRSSDKTSKPKRRGDVTPEKSLTPVPSMVGVSDESQAVTNVLSREDIQSLVINIDELEKNRPPKCPVVQKTSRQVTVRKNIKMKEYPTDDLKEGKMVTVARPTRVDSEFNTYERIGNNDPRLDDTTPFFEHHILGTLEEFQEQNEKKLQAKKIPISFNDKKHSPVPSTNIIKGRVFPPSIYKPNIDQSNALNNWERQMAQRRKQQGHLAKLLNTSTEMLGMNQGEEYRTTQEERHLIDRSIPSKDYGKGYRVGSEFWNQAELIGDDDTGIHMTLTQTERGYPPVVEHVGKPVSVRQEMGVGWSETDSLRTTAIHFSWKKSKYLETRKDELKEVVHELCLHKPYLQKLEVVGEPLDSSASGKRNSTQSGRIDSLSPRIYETLPEDEEENDPLSAHPDVFPEAIFGPSLTIAGRSAQWNGSTNNRLGEVGISCRVLLEAKVDDRVVSTLDVFNDGTAAIYYSWKNVPKVAKLGTTLAGRQQRFYFDKNSGVILPGDTLKFPFIFKSTNPGMFSEEWQLDTQPVLSGGAAIRVVLRGLALQDDLNAEKRDCLEKELDGRQARQIVQSIMQEILNGIRSPQRPASPVDAYLTDEESFSRRHPEICYNEEVIQELKQLHDDIDPDEEWDFSLSSLRQLIMMNEYEEEEQRDGYLSRLNLHVKDLAFPQRYPIKQEMYSTCYVMLCEMVDDIVAHSDRIRTSMGLPLREMIEGTSMVDDGQDKKTMKKSSEGGRLTAEKKDGKKEKKSGDRPISSHKLKTPADKKSSSRGGSRNQIKLSAEEYQDESVSAPVTPPELISPEQSANLVAESQYREKHYVQAYTLVSETVEKIAGMFEEIENSRQQYSF